MLLPPDSANDRYSSSLTQGELAEISTRKMRAELPPEATRWSKNELAEFSTKKVNSVLPVSSGGQGVQPVLAPSAHPTREGWLRWYSALKKILPVYVAVHIAMLAISCLAFLYNNPDFASRIMPVSTLWTQWQHWDTGHYVQIAL